MSYYPNGAYSFSDLSQGLSTDERFLKHLIRKGGDLSVVIKSPQFDDLLAFALRDSRVSPVTLKSLLNIPLDEKHNQSSAARRVTAVQGLLHDGDRDHIVALAPIIAQSLNTIPVRKIDSREDTEGEIFNTLMSLALNSSAAEDAFSEVTSVIASRYKVQSMGFQPQRDQVFPMALEAANHFASVPSGSLRQALDRAAADNSRGWVLASRHSLVDALILLALSTEKIDQVRDLLDSAVSPALDKAKIAAHAVADTGGLALEIVKSGDQAAIGSLFSHFRSAPVVNGVKKGVWFGLSVMESTSDEWLRRAALILVLEGNPDYAAPYLEDFSKFLERECDNLDAPSARNGYLDVSARRLMNVANNGVPVEFIPTVLSCIKAKAGPAAHFGDADGFIRQIADRVPNAKGRVTPDLAVQLWEALVQERTGVSPSSSVPSAEQALVLSGALPEELLLEIAKGRSKAAMLARRLAAGESVDDLISPAPASAPQDSDAWDSSVTKTTPFATYLELALNSGISAPAAMGLYCADTRIDMPNRKDARKDFVLLLCDVPEYADEVPDDVWSALNRVKDPLPVTTELSERLLGLGEHAQRFGSRNLVKTAMF